MKNNKQKRIKNYVKNHKKKVYITLGLIGVAGLSYIGVKHLPKIQTKKIIEETTKITQEVCQELPHKEIWSNLSGEELTPTKLGNEVLLSAQVINKKLVECGLQTRLPNGEYICTELGKKFGTVKVKQTKHEFTFCNIEWDKRVLELIFSKEELAQLYGKRQKILEIVAA